MSWRALLFAALYATLVFGTVSEAECASHSERYNSVMRLVRNFSTLPNVRLLPFGKLDSDRCIPAFLITDLSEKSTGKLRILICSGQHGDEFLAVKSILALSCKLASGAQPELLRKCVFVVIPMVNPDGVAANTRWNAERDDINRGWINPFTTESVEVANLIDAWRPQLMIDAHEQTTVIPGGGTLIEAPHCLIPDQAHAVRNLASEVSEGLGIRLVNVSPASDKSLFHRNYACIGYGAYLIETDVNASPQEKERVYASVIIAMARKLVSNPGLSAVISPTSQKFHVSSVSAYLTPLPEPQRTIAGVTYVFGAMIAGYAICLWVLKPFSQKPQMRRSHRFVLCDLDDALELDALCARRPTPITARSLTRRRLRAHYDAQTKPEPDQAQQEPQQPAIFIKPKYAAIGAAISKIEQLSESRS